MDYMLMMVVAGDDALIAEVNRLATEGVDENPVNQAPVIEVTPPSAAAAGSQYEFTPTASDPDGEFLSFSASGLPSWASVDPANGTLSGSPELADIGIAQGISMTATDGESSATLGPFSIEVIDPVQNQPPVISGTPPGGVDAGSFYEFTPTASDPNGDTRSFTGTSITAWLSLDPSSGTLSGMPRRAMLAPCRHLNFGLRWRVLGESLSVLRDRELEGCSATASQLTTLDQWTAGKHRGRKAAVQVQATGER